MARFARIVALDMPHHFTQRGNGRQVIFESDSDRLTYLELLRANCRQHELSVAGYCLMPNHVHLIVTPRRTTALQFALKQTHGRFAAYFNARRAASGHVWQGRYFSCPLDTTHFWAALRYTELNPVRAGMVSAPEAFRWSSAGAHCLPDRKDDLLDSSTWNKVWDPVSWREFLVADDRAEHLEALRRNTHTGRPLGDAAFVKNLEGKLQRRLSPQKGGRPVKDRADQRQHTFAKTW
jgi:putative transposase